MATGEHWGRAAQPQAVCVCSYVWYDNEVQHHLQLKPRPSPNCQLIAN